MKHINTLSIVIVLLLSISALASAEPLQRLEDSWYIGGSIGASTLDPDVPAGSRVIDDKSLSIKGYAGVNITPSIGLEAFWSHLGESGISGSAGQGAVKYSALGVNGIFHLPVNAGRFHPFGKLGIAKINTKSSAVALNQKNNFAVFGGLGTDYDLSRGLKLRAEYNYFTQDISEMNIGLTWSPGEQRNYRPGNRNIPKALPISGSPVRQAPQATTLRQSKASSKTSTINTTLSGASLFKSGSTRLSSAGIYQLNLLIIKIRHPGFKLHHIIISGYTDNRGSARKNLILSRKRAEAVASYLSSRGVLRSKMSVVGLGESQPAATNRTAAGRAKNRRVEITIKGVQQVTAGM